jgi:hypothetical protein
MLGVEAVAEGMTNHVIGHHPTMPGVGKAAQAVVATGRFEHSLHASMMTIVPSLCKIDGRAARVRAGVTRSAPCDGTQLSTAPGLSRSV